MPRRIEKERRQKAKELYRQGASVRKVAGELRVSPRSIWDILVRDNEPRRSISEANMKYPKTDFSGDPTE